ncbi:DUF6124 family protein [Pseudomonas chlororaphis]|uniref:DUF6124 family protein n=1 Tax=Pseudomonas chlororaphis TaxID=587753 RepID=UPI0006A65607|nr:hypothetical protein [Pseudomonas chlororaphis]
MKKIVPDPPVMADSFSSAKMDPAKFENAAHKAINHYLFPTANNAPVPRHCPGTLFRVDPNLSTEEALSNACEILESAASATYQSIEDMPVASRKVVLVGVRLIEMAQVLVEAVLEREEGRGRR